MVGTLKRSIKKLVQSTNVEWDICFECILSKYRRRPGADGKSQFQVMFGVKPKFAYEQPITDLVAQNAVLFREF